MLNFNAVAMSLKLFGYRRTWFDYVPDCY